MPFALVAVVLLLSAGLGALYAARLGQDEAAHRALEARLDALRRLADLVHAEVAAQAEHLALAAVRDGTDGWINESRVDAAFRDRFAAYLGERFPRIVRGVRIDIEGADAAVRLTSRRMVDAVPRNATRSASALNVSLAVPDPSVAPTWGEVDRLAYPAIVGSVDYRLAVEGAELRTSAPLLRVVPVPAALMEAKLGQAVRAGTGDLAGVGRTVKAILATLVQVRVLDGVASAARPGTTTADVLTVADVELAVNLAMLLEQVRRFRSFDPMAASAIDAARPPLPRIPEGSSVPAEGRTVAALLDRFARDGALDPVDLHALFTGLDARGLSVAAVLAQAIAAIADDLALRHLDYLGLAPLADWVATAAQETGDALDGFLRWLGGRPSRQVEYVHQYVRAMFLDTGIGTAFFGPATVSLPARAYDVANGSGTVRIATPAHALPIPFPTKDLLAREFDGFWASVFPRFNASVARVQGSLRALVNDVAAKIANDAVLSGLLPANAPGPVDPRDNATLLAGLGARVGRAVDEAIAWFRTQPGAVDALMATVWSATRGALADVVDRLKADHPFLVGAHDEILRARTALADDLYAWAQGDPAFARLNGTQRSDLRDAIRVDVLTAGWATDAYESRRLADGRRWDRALAAIEGVPLPGDPDVRARLREVVVGAGGWLSVARDAVHGVLAETARAQGVLGVAVALPTRLDPFRLWDPRRPEAASTEAFTVAQSPRYLRATEGLPIDVPPPGELWIRVADPASAPAAPESGNVHFTRPFEASHRPFATTWSVEVRGAVRLAVATRDPVLLGPSGPIPATVTAVWPLDFAFAVPAYSGWNLTGVRYATSDTLAADAWAVLDKVLALLWDGLATVATAVLDVLRAAVEVLLDLLEPLLAFAHRVVEFLVDLAGRLADVLHDLAVGAANGFAGIVDAFLDAVPPGHASTMSAFGLTFRTVLNGPEGRELDLTVSAGGLAARVEFRDLVEAGRPRPDGLRYDVLAAWNVSAGPFRLDAGFDPFLAIQPTIARGVAAWAGSWRLDFEGPVADPFYHATLAYGIGPIPAPPLGTVDVEVGLRVLLKRDLVAIVEGWIRGALADAERAMAGVPFSWDYAARFAAAFAEALVRAAVALLDAHAADLVEVALYVEIHLDAAGGPAGLGAHLALAADGLAVRDVLAWLVHNVATFFASLLNPLAAADYVSLPGRVAQHTFVRAGAYVRAGLPKAVARLLPDLPLEVRLAARIGANVAALGALAGQDWGPWEVTFGAALQVPSFLPDVFGGRAGAGGTLWILRGTLRGA